MDSRVTARESTLSRLYEVWKQEHEELFYKNAVMFFFQTSLILNRRSQHVILRELELHRWEDCLRRKTVTATLTRLYHLLAVFQTCRHKEDLEFCFYATSHHWRHIHAVTLYLRCCDPRHRKVSVRRATEQEEVWGYFVLVYSSQRVWSKSHTDGSGPMNQYSEKHQKKTEVILKCIYIYIYKQLPFNPHVLIKWVCACHKHSVCIRNV